MNPGCRVQEPTQYQWTNRAVCKGPRFNLWTCWVIGESKPILSAQAACGRTIGPPRPHTKLCTKLDLFKRQLDSFVWCILVVPLRHNFYAVNCMALYKSSYSSSSSSSSKPTGWSIGVRAEPGWLVSQLYNCVHVDCTYKSTPKFSPQTEEKMQYPRISRPIFFRFNMEIYFVAHNEASVRQFNRRCVSARSVLWNNQAATIYLRPSYCPIIVSLFCSLNNDKTCPSDCTVIARLSPPSAVAWQLARLLLPERCSVVCLPVGRPSVRSPGSCSACHHPQLPPPVARAIRVSRRPLRPYQITSQIPAETQLRSIVRCSHGLVSTSVAAT